MTNVHAMTLLPTVCAVHSNSGCAHGRDDAHDGGVAGCAEDKRPHAGSRVVGGWGHDVPERLRLGRRLGRKLRCGCSIQPLAPPLVCDTLALHYASLLTPPVCSSFAQT